MGQNSPLVIAVWNAKMEIKVEGGEWHGVSINSDVNSTKKDFEDISRASVATELI